MEAYVVDQAPRLRRYAHALLGSWPAAPRDGGRPRVDQDADDLVHEALIDFWRAGFRKGGTFQAALRDASVLRGAGMRIALLRRVTDLARGHFVRKARDILESGGARTADSAACAGEETHFAWAPEARALPQLDLELRAVLALVALERLDYAQAGSVLGMSPDRALARLAVARAQLAGAIAGESRSHLAALADLPPEGSRLRKPVTDADLHLFVDDLLDQARRAEVVAALEAHPELLGRAGEWRRQCARLRRAFEPLLSEPLPLSLNFAAPEVSDRAGDGRRRANRAGDRIFRRLAALLAPAGPSAQGARKPL
jgi:DNA-directed RNA polymerase specialized sigma24 family protein